MVDLQVLLKKSLPLIWVFYDVEKGTFYNTNSLERMKPLIRGKTPGQVSVKQLYSPGSA